MKFVYASPQEAAAEIIETFTESMGYGSVLLLVSGGSNIDVAVTVRNSIKLTNHVTVGLIDERYGPPGHADSNWTQLLDAGFDTRHVHLLPVMIDDRPIADAALNYRERLEDAMSKHDTVIGIFGIGADGHTAGILPNSPALESHEIVTYFNGPDFQRITITPAVMPLFNAAYLVSYSASKHEQIKRLHDTLTPAEQPAQVLKQIPNVVVFTDYRNDTQS